ncbi:DUF6790 family protein [Microvirga guangxiensis]|uniref:Uncharacterized protein n=1 Tax=Microvirga guangxiensis TaxID=549386 RepID=A0A1G5LFF8_9HYPH|nr:DUF6790 family protein [Microvirga guangxiensis]SCZ11526.1 hypothetical protein SAMN02927923_04257 [Microvirga guangxiensis]
MEQTITFLLSNFTLTFFVLGLIAALISLLRQRGGGVAAEALLSWFLFFALGVTFLYNFVMHVFFSEMAASFIGWQTSPFQKEVGFASLGFSVVGFLAFRGGFGARLAALVGPACFLWGAAAGHVVQMVEAHNYAPGNAGVIFYTDILIPVFGFILLWLRYRAGSTSSDPARLSAASRL